MATFNTVATSVSAVLQAVANAPPISIRKVFDVNPREAQNEPLCVISFGTDETELWGTIGDGVSDFGDTGKRFKIIVTYIAESFGNVQTDLSTVPDWWQAAKRALNVAALFGVLGSWNVEIETSEAWEKVAWGQGQEVSEMTIHVGVSENRHS